MVLTFPMLTRYLTQQTLSARDLDKTFGLHKFQLQAMLKRVVHSLGLVEHTDRNPRRKNQVRGTKTSPDMSLRSRGFFVKIVHAGGQQELYQHAIPASKLMAKYPGMCVARPEVFKAPHQSVLWPEERLLAGHKYIIISSRDVEKLKRKHPEQGKGKELNGVVAQQTLEAKTTRSPNGHKPKERGKISVPKEVAAGQETTVSPRGCKFQENGKVKDANGLGQEKVNPKMNVSADGVVVEEASCSAKYLCVPENKGTRYPRRKGIKGQNPFVPPLPRARSRLGLGWQPSLPTVQELSP